MSYSQRTTIRDGRRQGRPLLFWLFGAAIGVCVLGLIGYRLFPGIYAWVTRTGPYADIVTIKVTNTGFEPRSVTLSANQLLHIVNASSHAIVICTGSKQICNQNAAASTIPAAGLTIQPGKTYDLRLKNGNYGFTIVPQVGLAFAVTDLGVSVRAASNNSVDSSSDSSGVDSGGDGGGSSVSSGGDTGGGSGASSGGSSSNNDEEESGASSGSSTSSGADDSSSSSSTSSGADDSSSAGGAADGGDE